jgi:hypothetical protein
MKSVFEIQEIIIQRAKEKGAFIPEIELKVNDDLKSLLLKAIIKDFDNLWREKVITVDFLKEYFREKELSAAGIFVEGIHYTTLEDITACGDAVVNDIGCSTSQCFGHSIVSCIGGTHSAYEHSTIETLSNSIIRAHDSAKVRTGLGCSVVYTYDNATLITRSKTVEIRDGKFIIHK